MSLGLDAHLRLQITSLPPVMTKPGGGLFVTVPVATYGALTGVFANITVEMSYPVARSMATSPCYEPTNSTPIYSQSTLSVVVDLQSCGGGGLSTGAIVGIAVGAAAGGILLIVILAIVVSSAWFSTGVVLSVVFQLHKSTAARTVQMNQSLRDKNLNELQNV